MDFGSFSAASESQKSAVRFVFLLLQIDLNALNPRICFFFIINCFGNRFVCDVVLGFCFRLPQCWIHSERIKIAILRSQHPICLAIEIHGQFQCEQTIKQTIIIMKQHHIKWTCSYFVFLGPNMCIANRKNTLSHQILTSTHY